MGEVGGGSGRGLSRGWESFVCGTADWRAGHDARNADDDLSRWTPALWPDVSQQMCSVSGLDGLTDWLVASMTDRCRLHCIQAINCHQQMTVAAVPRPCSIRPRHVANTAGTIHAVHRLVSSTTIPTFVTFMHAG